MRALQIVGRILDVLLTVLLFIGLIVFGWTGHYLLFCAAGVALNLYFIMSIMFKLQVFEATVKHQLFATNSALLTLLAEAAVRQEKTVKKTKKEKTEVKEDTNKKKGRPRKAEK